MADDDLLGERDVNLGTIRVTQEGEVYSLKQWPDWARVRARQERREVEAAGDRMPATKARAIDEGDLV